MFIAGGTGYIGRALIPQLLARGHRIHALARPGSESKLPGGCEVVTGNALDAASFVDRVKPADTFVQLVGVPHPSPAKARQFREIDKVSGLASLSAALDAGIGHFVYVSVAHPAPVMKAYTQTRSEVEAAIRKSGINATILRPWYVLGSGHRWPYLLLPWYWLFEKLPFSRDIAQRLGLLTLAQVVNALVVSVESPTQGTRVLSVPEIRQLT